MLGGVCRRNITVSSIRFPEDAAYVVGGGYDAHCQLLRHFAVCLSGGYEERLPLHPSAYAFMMSRGDSNPLRERLPEGECMA